MKELKTRLLDHIKYHINICRTERAVDDFLKDLNLPIPDKCIADPSIYEHSSYIYFNFEMDQVEFVELKLIPAISDIIGKGQFEKGVDNSGIHYHAFYEGEKTLSINISIRPDSTCEIKRIPTGKVKSVAKTVHVEEPEYDTVINCGGE